MDEEYVLRDFKNAKVTKQAVVTIDNVEHEVTPAQVQGNLLKAEDLNYMDNKIKNLYDKNLINKTVVELKTVAEETPTQCEEGDLYYDTTTNLIYEATGKNTWGSTGEIPSNKYLYVDKTNSKLYYYDGQNFKSYGGGGGINLVTEDGTIPTELFIGTNSFATTGTEVVNDLNGNETNKAPSVKAVKDKFNQLNVYSTEEHDVGKWIDGKTLYEKTIFFPNGTGQTEQKDILLTEFAINNVDEIFLHYPSFYTLGVNRYPFNFYDGNTFMVILTNTNMMITLGFETIANSRVVITLRYTKTTDTPISINEGVDE